MAIPKEFTDALRDNNVTALRILMKNSLLLDRSFATIRKMQAEARNIPNLYQPFNNKDLNRDKSQWNEDLLNRQLAKLMMNFCPERIEYLKEIITAIYPKEEAVEAASASASSRPETHASFTSSSYNAQDKDVPYHVQKQRDMQKGHISKVVYCTGGGAVLGGVISMAAGTNILVGSSLGAAIGAIGGLVIKEVKSQ